MSIYKGTTLLAGSPVTIPLFTPTWQDHLLNDISWLRADTFSWQSGLVYTAAYQHLVNDYDNTPSTILAPNGITYVRDPFGDYYKSSTMTQYYAWSNSDASDDATVYTTYTFPRIGVTPVYRKSGTNFISLGKVADANARMEIISGQSIRCKVVQDGHKIVLAEQETNVDTLYSATGVAWYYILDTTNQRFKLPRSKWNFVGLRTSVGTYVEESLPNINITTCGIGETNSMYHRLAGYADSGVARGDGVSGVLTEPLASQVSSTYKDNAPVQQNATEMHLYFYIGQFTQTAIQQTAGITSETLNAKADRAELASKVDLSALTNLCVPDYARCIAGGLITAGTWIQTPTDAQVVVWGTDPYTEDFKALVSPDSGQTQYEVGYRSDDYNGYTQGTSFSFLVPKNWYFTCGAEQGFHYRIYPLKGAN